VQGGGSCFILSGGVHSGPVPFLPPASDYACIANFKRESTERVGGYAMSNLWGRWFYMMRIRSLESRTSRLILSMTLLLFIEGFYSTVTRVDSRHRRLGDLVHTEVGVPFRSVTYTTDQLGEETGFEIRPLALVGDVFAAILLWLVLAVLVPVSSLWAVAAGCILGLSVGVGARWLFETLTNPWTAAIATLVVFCSVVPPVSYVLSLRHVFPHVVIIVAVACAALTFGRSQGAQGLSVGRADVLSTGAIVLTVSGLLVGEYVAIKQLRRAISIAKNAKRGTDKGQPGE
jgi:hypothetical protein